MAGILRVFYRFFIKNRLIRWTWMLSLAVFGVYYATEHGIMKKNAPLQKTVFELDPNQIEIFTIRNNDDDMTFTRADAGWLVVKNNITVPISEDTITLIFNLLKKVESSKLVYLPTTEGPNEKPILNILISENNNENRQLSIFYTEKDSVSGDIFTYIKLPNERLLHGIKGDWLAVLNKNFNDFRNKTILDFKPQDITQIEFRGLVDTAVFIARDTNFQYFNTRFSVLQEDFKKYIKSLSQLRGSAFYDNSRDFKETKNIDNQIVIKLKTDSIALTTYRVLKGFVVHSTQNDDAIFKVDSANIYFKDIKQFIRLKRPQ